jgi:hypothetical protein
MSIQKCVYTLYKKNFKFLILMYRIAWKTIDNITFIHGHGLFCFNTLESAQSFADSMNKEHKDEINHWVETKESNLFQASVFQAPKNQNLKTLDLSCALPRVRGKAKNKNAGIFLKMT